MNLKVTILLLFISCSSFSQKETRSRHPEYGIIGWTHWKYDTSYYENGVIMEIRQSKRKRRHLGSTRLVIMHKVVEFDTNGKWYFKQKYKTDAGCFHYQCTVKWKRERSRTDDTTQVAGFI